MEEARNPPRNGEGTHEDDGEAGIIFGRKTEKDTKSRRTGKRKNWRPVIPGRKSRRTGNLGIRNLSDAEHGGAFFFFGKKRSPRPLLESTGLIDEAFLNGR